MILWLSGLEVVSSLWVYTYSESGYGFMVIDVIYIAVRSWF